MFILTRQQDGAPHASRRPCACVWARGACVCVREGIAICPLVMFSVKSRHRPKPSHNQMSLSRLIVLHTRAGGRGRAARTRGNHARTLTPQSPCVASPRRRRKRQRAKTSSNVLIRRCRQRRGAARAGCARARGREAAAGARRRVGLAHAPVCYTLEARKQSNEAADGVQMFSSRRTRSGCGCREAAAGGGAG
jgi:hypothetical protein